MSSTRCWANYAGIIAIALLECEVLILILERSASSPIPTPTKKASRHFDAESYPDDDQSKRIEISAFENHIVLALIIPLQPTTRTTFARIIHMCACMFSHKNNEKITSQPKQNKNDSRQKRNIIHS